MSDDFLLDEGRSVNEEAICAACCAGDVAAVRRLLRLEPTLVGATGSVREDHRTFMANMGGEKGWSPLHLAAHYGQLEVVRELIAAGADVNARSRNKIGNRPLGAAVAGGRLEVVKLLLQSGAEVNGVDVGGLSPLHLAMGERRDEIAAALLAAGADRGAKDKKGKAPGEK